MRNLYFVILALLIGCAKQSLEDDNMLTITAFSTSFDTKATETAFESGDVMGVFMENNASNLRYETSDGVSWKGYGNLTQFKTGDNVTAYYPFNANATNMNAIEVASGVDFMITEPTPITVVENQASAALNFKHVLSKLVVSMEIPSEINGLKTVSLESITVKNVFRKGVIDITTKAITGLTDVGDVVLTSGEAIIIPQTISRIEFSFKMEGGGSATLAHTKPITLTPGTKTTLQAISNADLYFSSSLDLKHGDAQANLPLSIFAASVRTWTLVSSAPAWLTVTPAGGTGAATVKASVTANTASPYAPRTAMLTLKDDKGALAYLSVMQNYSKFEPVTTAWNASAGSGQSGVLGAFAANRVWSAYFGNNSNGWVSLNNSATAGVGKVTLPYTTIGSLGANTLWLQTIAANNTDAAKTEKLKFDIDGSDAAVRELVITQAAPTLTLSANQNVAPHITSAAFNVIAPANYWGVTYTPKVGTNAISVSPNTVVTIPSAAAYSGAVTVGFAANTTAAARNVTAIVGYGATKTATFTATQAVAYLNISAPSASVGVDVGSSNFTLNANVPYSSAYSAGGSSAQGVGNTPPYANAGVTFNYPAQPAAPSAARNHVMTVTPNPANGAGAVARTFTVSQAARPVSLSMSPLAPGVVVPKTGGTYYTTVTTNASWSVTSSSNVTTSISGATLTITVGANSASSTRALSATVTTSNAAGQNNLSATWSGTQEASGPPTVYINGTKWTMANLTASYQGQTSGFTVEPNPQDWGFFWKWGSVFAYEHAGSGNPANHWNSSNNYSTGAATQPTAQGHGYDYANISSLGGNIGGPIGDPCQSLGANYKTPTHAQWQALKASGISAWTTYQNRAGYFFGPKAASCNNTTIQDGCIFLPAASYRTYSNGSLYGESSEGYYWSSSVYNSNNGWRCSFDSGGVYLDYYSLRGNGISVRCVQQ